MKKYIITGGPGIGKTTVIEILASRGYTIVPEAAGMIIEEEEVKGSEILPWLNLQKFQEVVSQRQLALEEKDSAEITFHDRGIIDGYAYSILGNVTPPEVIEKLGRNRYEQVFILDPLPFYQNDPSRREGPEEAKRIHDAILEAYIYFGYKPVLVPVLSPDARVEYILANI